MHAKKLGRWVKMIFATLTVTALIGFTVQTSSQAVSVNPIPVCSEGTCVMTFDYSGDRYNWVPPTDISNLHFDVYGAQGGRGGGKGGLISGDFVTIPSEIFIFVGGAGSQGNLVAGGFNGGGISGSGHSDNGSGGGASDIRTSVSISDRVVVAGGGGGMGGWIGGAGGAGGGAIAVAGSAGGASTSGGGGGSQSAGGARGSSNAYNTTTEGVFAVGGTGGTASVAGGGGGGGGYFGGGGGGADGVSGGMDGAGGGGGSSYATLLLTSNIQHQQGVRSGNGLVVLTYTRAPKVTSFTAAAAFVTTANPSYSIVFDHLVTDLTKYDFTLTGTATGCTISDLLGDGYAFTFTVTGCTNGTLRVSLHPNSVFSSALGPTTEVFAEPVVAIDNVLPGFSLKSPGTPTKSTSLIFQLTSDEPFQKPLASSFVISGTGCAITSIDQPTTTMTNINVSGCASGSIVSLRMLPNSVADLSGNLGPTIAIESSSVTVDADAPQVAAIIANPPSGELTEYLITFDEAVTGVNSSTFNLSGVGCAISKIDGSGTAYNVWLSGCTDTPTLTVKALSVSDSAGNLGPTTSASNGSAVIDKIPPTALIVETPRTDKNASPVFEITFSEKISGLTIDSFTRVGTAKDCLFKLVEVLTGRSFRVETSNCGIGTLKLSLPALSITDLHANAGPLVATQSPNAVISPKPAVVVSSTVTASKLISSEPTEAAKTTPVIVSKQKSSKPKTNTQVDPWKAPTDLMNTLGVSSWIPMTIAIVALAIAKRPRRGARRETIRK